MHDGSRTSGVHLQVCNGGRLRQAQILGERGPNGGRIVIGAELPANHGIVRQCLDYGREHAGDAEVIGAVQSRVADQNRVIGPHRQPGPQRFPRPLRADADQGHRTAELLPQPQAGLGRMLIVVVHHQGQTRLVDPATVRGDPDWGFCVRYLFDADNDVHDALQ